MSAKDASRIHVPSPDEMESLGIESGHASKREPQSAEAESTDVETLRAERDHWKDRAHRAVADYKNLERRAETQRYDASQAAIGKFALTLLPIIDDLERSLAAAEQAGETGSLVDGVKLIHEKIMKALADEGIETIPAVGRPFDPNCHEAMLARPSDDYPPHTVLDELARGYKLGDRVLRAAKVIVSAGPAGEE